MLLKTRLAALRRTLPAASPAERKLVQRIDRLRVSRDSGEKIHKDDQTDLHQTLNGIEIADGVILVEKRIAFGTTHGNRKLGAVGMGWNDLPDAVGLKLDNLLFLDTETTGLCGGSGSLAFMIGMARLEQDDFVLRQYLLTRFGGEQAMLNAADSWIKRGDVLVTYNGKSFDLPLLSTRYRMVGLPDSLQPLPHVDLLYPVRRAFSGRWDDCRLARAERQLLGFYRHNDLPGAEAPGAWFDWIRLGKGARLPLVCRHNQWDLLSLALLLPQLSEVYRSPLSYGANPLAVARAYCKMGWEARALALLLELKQELEEDGLTELARLLKRGGERQAARAIWMSLSARGNQNAREQMAMHLEHDRRDYGAALAYAELLYEDDGKQQRCNRLRRKLAVTGRQSQIEYG